MDLWIRSQDKDMLLKTESLLIDDNNNDIYTQDFISDNLVTYTLGKYKTRERAIEVLDEIQNKIKTLLYLKPSVLLNLEDIKAGKSYLEELNKQEFIVSDNNFEIIPISNHAVIYEMPQE